MSSIVVVLCLMAVINVVLGVFYIGLAKQHADLREMFSTVTTLLTGAIAGDEDLVRVCRRVHGQTNK